MSKARAVLAIICELVEKRQRYWGRYVYDPFVEYVEDEMCSMVYRIWYEEPDMFDIHIIEDEVCISSDPLRLMWSEGGIGCVCLTDLECSALKAFSEVVLERMT